MQGRPTVMVLAVSLIFGALAAACGVPVPRPSPSPSRATTRTSQCRADQLIAQVWTDLPALSHIMEGITFTSTSSTPCTLPEFPTSFALETASGSVIPPTALPEPSDTATSTTDFFDSGSEAAPVTDMLPSFAGLPTTGVTLAPGSNTVIVLFGSNGFSATQSGCLAAAAGDQLAVSFSAGQATIATIPISTFASGPGTNNPAGSALFTCNAFVVSPTMGWSRATRLLGPLSSVISSSPQLYAAAP